MAPSIPFLRHLAMHFFSVCSACGLRRAGPKGRGQGRRRGSGRGRNGGTCNWHLAALALHLLLDWLFGR